MPRFTDNYQRLRRGKVDSFSRNFEGNAALLSFDLTSRIMREYISVVLNIQFVAICYSHPRKLNIVFFKIIIRNQIYNYSFKKY